MTGIFPNKKAMAMVFAGIGVLAVLVIVSLAFIARAQSQSEAQTTAQLNQDLIQSKVALEGWQMEIARGNVTDASDPNAPAYRAAMNTDLNSMKDDFQKDYNSY